MKALIQNVILALLAVVFLTSATVPAPANRGESRGESQGTTATSKKEQRQQAKEDRLTKRLHKAKNSKKRQKIRKKLNKPKKSNSWPETRSLLAFIFGLVGLCLVALAFIFAGTRGYGYHRGWWELALLLCLTAVIFGIWGKIEGDGGQQLLLGLIFGAIGLGIAFLIFLF